MIIENKSRQLAIIVSASLAGFMALLDGNIVNISLPYIAAFFKVGTSLVVQIVLIYLVVLAGTMITFGKLADQLGVKKIFISGFVIFTLSSLVCGFAGSIHFLIFARAIQALGASMLFTTAVSLIPRYIPAEKRGWAFGIFSPISSLGLLIGNPLGGLITGLLNWHWIFLINVPIGIVAVLVAWKSLPNDRNHSSEKNTHVKFDFAGSLLSFAGLALLVYFLNQGRKLGWGNFLTIGGIVTALVLLGFFFWREKVAKNPVLDLSIFHDHNFTFGIVASFAGFGLMAGSSILMPFYLTYVLKMNVEHAGFVLMTFAVVFSAMSTVSGNLSDRISKTRLTIFGMISAMVTCLFFILCIPLVQLWVVFIFLVGLGFSYAFFITPNNNLMMSLANPEKQAISSSVFKLSTNLGQMIGILLMEILFTIPMPSDFHANKVALHSISSEVFYQGFQWAYAGGLLMCLIALGVSFLIKEKSKEKSDEIFST
ncbi:MAG: MFS transporter [Bacteroidales bacterium]|nr:MFS transporter [Bacteroidales bacterium]